MAARSQNGCVAAPTTSGAEPSASQLEFWQRERVKPPLQALERSAELMHRIIAEYQPTSIVSLVSGGRDSSMSQRVAEMLDVRVDAIMHGRTGTGIPQTTQFVVDHYGNAGPDFYLADAGTKYEEYVIRKGFFGVGRDAHNFSYRILKQDPFNATLSREIIKRQRGHRVMLLTGARKLESENRHLNLPVTNLKKGKLWVNICHDWSSGERDQLLDAEQVPINPVATQLCRSGECMCGTMQTQADRLEASALYPEWGGWLNDLDRAAKRKFGFGWGETHPKPRDPNQGDLFEPMCSGCKGSLEDAA